MWVVMGGRKCGLGQARGYSGGGRGWLGAGDMFVVGYLNLSELIRTNRKVSMRAMQGVGEHNAENRNELSLQ